MAAAAPRRPPLTAEDLDALRARKPEDGGGQLDLRNVDFHGASLAYLDLRRVDLTGADLSGVDLKNTSLEGAHLEDVDGLAAWQLRGANLTGAHLPEAIKKFEGLK